VKSAVACARLHGEALKRAARQEERQASALAAEEEMLRTKLKRHEPRPGVDANTIVQRLYQDVLDKKTHKEQRAAIAAKWEVARLAEQQRKQQAKMRPDTFQRLYEDSEQRIDRLQKLRDEAKEAELSQLQRSRQDAMPTRRGNVVCEVARHERLYQDHMRRSEALEKKRQQHEAEEVAQLEEQSVHRVRRQEVSISSAIAKLQATVHTKWSPAGTPSTTAPSTPPPRTPPPARAGTNAPKTSRASALAQAARQLRSHGSSQKRCTSPSRSTHLSASVPPNRHPVESGADVVAGPEAQIATPVKAFVAAATAAVVEAATPLAEVAVPHLGCEKKQEQQELQQEQQQEQQQQEQQQEQHQEQQQDEQQQNEQQQEQKQEQALEQKEGQNQEQKQEQKEEQKQEQQQKSEEEQEQKEDRAVSWSAESGTESEQTSSDDEESDDEESDDEESDDEDESDERDRRTSIEAGQAFIAGPEEAQRGKAFIVMAEKEVDDDMVVSEESEESSDGESW